MTYLSWDDGTAALDRTTAFTHHLAGTAGAGHYLANSNKYPNKQEIEDFLTDSYYEIGGLLRQHGYAIAQIDTSAKGLLTSLQIYTATIKAELTQPSVSNVAEGNERFIEFRRAKDALEAIIAGGGLGVDAVVTTTTLDARVHVGGISRDRKRSVTNDTDLVQARFKRGYGQEVTGPANVESDRYSP